MVSDIVQLPLQSASGLDGDPRRKPYRTEAATLAAEHFIQTFSVVRKYLAIKMFYVEQLLQAVYFSLD